MMIDILRYYTENAEKEFDSDYDLAVLIDVYRATSSMVVAGFKEAHEIVAVNTLEEMYIEKAKDDLIILCGERKALKPKEFDHGNSPLRLLDASLKDKKVLISTSNGTRTLSAFKDKSAHFIAASFLNISATIDYIKENNYKKILLLCAGSWEKFSLEDYLCACVIFSHFEKDLEEIDDDQTLQIMTGKYYNANKTELQKTLKNTDHAKRLKNIGKFDDVTFITSSIDKFNKIPKIKTL